MLTLRPRATCLLVASLALVASCGDSPTAPLDRPPPEGSNNAGFDISRYPGDGAMKAWAYPASPFKWVGYYLPAPCHRDTTWSGRRGTISAMGWGTAAIYVGQQDWRNIPDVVALDSMRMTPGERNLLAGRANAALSPANAPRMATAPSCSSTLLTIPQGSSEAADAAGKTSTNGFPAKSTVYLDVEYVSVVSPELIAYVRAWITGILADGRYLPGVYVAKSNAQVIRDAAMDVYATAGRTDAPRFWIAGSNAFTTTSKPTDIGVAYANVWQGMFNSSRFYGGWSLTVDLNVADWPSPSAPPEP